VYTLTGVTKRYGGGRRAVTALDGVDLHVADGDWLAISGRTGGGKSTLLHLLGGIDRPTAGTVEFDGRELTTLPEAAVTRLRAARIGFVFQTFNLIPTLSAAENVETALVPLGMPRAERRARVTEALAAVGLADRAGHLPSELSGGQQQRVGIARALAKRPRVLLADEPTGNLDEDTRDDILALLENLWHDHHLTLVLITHDTTVAARAPRRVVLRDGHLTDSAKEAPA
jgi:putative ABC transport system ATP-binding protein